ncbi:MAG: nuclear transport factor 2 family protein [Lachnospiraceae bacterium]|nr:nuclear transport factor 2 family protein [Lachnospiraceae bacterium]
MRAPREDYDAAAQAAANIFEAIIRKDSSFCKDSFLDGAVIFGQTGGKLNSGSYTNLLRQIESSSVGEEFNYRVDVIALEETIALVQVLENNYYGNYYTVYCTEMKIDGKWKVGSFIYNQNKEAY